MGLFMAMKQTGPHELFLGGLGGQGKLRAGLAGVFQECAAVLCRTLGNGGKPVGGPRGKTGGNYYLERFGLVDGDGSGLDPDALLVLKIEARRFFVGLVRFDFQARSVDGQNAADGHNFVDLNGRFVQSLGDKAVALIKAVKLNLDMAADILAERGAGLQARFGMDARGQVGFASVIFAGNADAQVKERRLDFIAVRGKVEYELDARGKALFDDAGRRSYIVDFSLAGNLVDVQFRLVNGFQVVGFFRDGQKSVGKLDRDAVYYVFGDKV